MSIEGPKLGISETELNNNDFNPELEKFLENNIISQEETDVLHDIFSEKRADIYHVSKQNLKELRDIIWSKSKKVWITDSDMTFLKNHKNKAPIKETTIKKIEKKEAKQNHINQNWILVWVSKNRLDQIILDTSKKISITFKNNNFNWSNINWETFNITWWKDIDTWKETFIFEDWELKWKRVKINDWDKLWEYSVQNKKTAEQIQAKKEHKSTGIKIEKAKPSNNESIATHDELIRKTPREFQAMMKEFLSKRTTNTWEKISSIDIMKVPLILLLNTKWKKWMSYVNWSFKIFDIINTWWSLKWKVWKLNKLKLSNNKLWDVSMSWSKTVVWASFMWPWMNAQWIHWVDERRLWWGTSRWCVWIWSDTLKTIAEQATWSKTDKNAPYRKWKSWKSRWKSVSSNVSTHNLSKPMFAYVV